MWLDSLGVKTVDEAAVKLAPIFAAFGFQLRGTGNEMLERFNGATVDLEIIDNKLRMTITLPPVSPPKA